MGTNFLNDTLQSETVDLRNLQGKAQGVMADTPHPQQQDKTQGEPAGSKASTTANHQVAHPSPLARTLYVTEQGALLGLRNARVILRHDGGEQNSVPLHRLDQIVLQGNQLLSTALLRACRENHADVFLSSFTGACEIRIDDLGGGGIDTWTAQVRMQEDGPMLIRIARTIVQAKLHNSHTVLRHVNRRRELPELEEIQEQLKKLREQVAAAEGIEALRGLEGIAAREYYRGLGILLAPRWTWPGRNRRPPKDPINALLSYGYGLLYQNVLGLLRRAGLNPYLGVYHQMRPGHPALASDLMEEFRALVVDRMVLNLLNDPKIQESDFVEDQRDQGSCRLSTDIRKRAIQSFENRINGQFTHPRTGEQSDYRRAILAQAKHLARVARGQDAEYVAFLQR